MRVRKCVVSACARLSVCKPECMCARENWSLRVRAHERVYSLVGVRVYSCVCVCVCVCVPVRCEFECAVILVCVCAGELECVSVYV